MPWENQFTQRLAFVEEASEEGANKSRICEKYGISRRTGYKWLKRYATEGEAGLVDQCRRPHNSPNRTIDEVEDLIVAERNAHPTQGARVIKHILEGRGHSNIPSASTITQILHRHGLISADESAKRKHKHWQRFERAAPNELWQMDFKGKFRLETGEECHPLTILDDHSRYVLGIRACLEESYPTAKRELTLVFQDYGLPDSILSDNGSPWGYKADVRYTIFGAWLLRLGIYSLHGRSHHPQTQGKIERMHRTLKADVIMGQCFTSLLTCQQAFDAWREYYNHQRPHQGIGMSVPADRYQNSSRSFPEQLPPLDYGEADTRKVDASGKFYLHGKTYYLSKAFRGEYIAIQPMRSAGLFYAVYAARNVAICNSNTSKCQNL